MDFSMILRGVLESISFSLRFMLLLVALLAVICAVVATYRELNRLDAEIYSIPTTSAATPAPAKH
jgi:hypothetical protein